MMQFDLPREEKSIIKVFGVGGGGSNAVNHMFRQGIKGVDFYVCNTDQQALDASPIPNKIQLGTNLTEGRGAGSVATVGAEAAVENMDEITAILEDDTRMVFVTAGMGGGTGTGAAPIIAQKAKEMGILTVGIVTYPFVFEGRKRSKQADEGLEQLRDSVDTLLIICNDKLREIYGNLSLKNAFAKADDILTTAAKGIAEIITVTGYINVDFEDVKTVMTDSGVAIMGSAAAEGENRAIEAVQEALSSPLLNDNNIEGANYILLNITSGEDEVLMDEISEITDYIQDEAGLTADIIWGSGTDENLGDKISVTLIATGFSSSKDIGGKKIGEQEPTKVIHNLEADTPANTVKEAPAEVPQNETPVAPVVETPTPEVEKEKPVIRYNLFDDVPGGPTAVNEEIKQEPSASFEAPVQEVSPEVEVPVEPIAATPVEAVSFEPEMEEQEIQTPVFETEAVEEAPSFSFEIPKQEMEAPIEELNEPEVASSPAFTWEAPSASVSTPVEPTPPAEESAFGKELEEEENRKRSQARIAQLKMMSQKMKSPSGIADLENQPAYVRRNVQLDRVTPSSEIDASRYTLGENDENNTEIRTNNSFLHDNVD